MVVMCGSPLSIVSDATEIKGVGANIHPYVMGRYSSEERMHSAGP